MVRTILFDKQANKYFQKILDDRISKSGLFIGHLNDSNDNILHVVPTPLNDHETKQEDLIVNHALQIHNMLVGGLDLLGVYLVDVQEENLNARMIMNSIYDNLNKLQYYKEMKFNSDRLMWLVESKSKNVIMKTIDLSDAKSNPQKCDMLIKDNLIDEYYTITSNFDLDSTFTMPNIYTHDLLKTQFYKTIIIDFLRNQNRFTCLVNNEHNQDENAKFCDLFAEKGEYRATLLENMSEAKEDSLRDGQQNLDSIYHVTGVSSSLVMFNKNSTLKHIKQLLIYDLIRSLFTRMRLLIEDLDARKEIIGEQNEEDPNVMEESYQTPNRIYICLNDAKKNLYISDYVFPDENDGDIAERIKQMLNFEINDASSQIINVETFPPEIRNAEFEAEMEQEMFDEVSNEASSTVSASKKEATQDNESLSKMFTPLLVAIIAVFITFLTWFLTKN